MNTMVEMWKFLRRKKKIWLFPVVLVMILLGALLVVAQGTAFAPLIYTLF